MNLIAVLFLSVVIRHELDIEDWGDPSSEGYTVVIHVNYTLDAEWTSVGGFAGEMFLNEGDFVQVWLTCHGAAEYHLAAFNLETLECVASSWEPGDDYIEWVAGGGEIPEPPEPPVEPGGGGGCGMRAYEGIGIAAIVFLIAFLFLRKVT